jgi:hypothetical protein
MRKLLATLMLRAALPACSLLPLQEPRAVGEINAIFDYIPLDPLEVAVGIDPLNKSATASRPSCGVFNS